MKTLETFYKNSFLTKVVILLFSVTVITGCNKDDGPAPEKEIAKSSVKQITSFVFLLTKDLIAVNIVGVLDEESKTVTVVMPPNTDITGLLPDIEITETAQVNPNTAQDFTAPVEYTVTAEDGSKEVYTITVTVALGQRQILQAILDANPGNIIGWDLATTTDLGTLDGITTNVEGNIITLDLRKKNLTQFSPEIGQLTSLTLLSLRSNPLTSIPLEIGQLSGLTSLNLLGNQLTSLPPEIGQLTNLTGLNLSYNQLTTLPPEIGQLTNLTDLILFDNQLTSIPPEIGQLTNLTDLSLFDNQLTSIPPEIGQLTNLTDLSLGINQLTSIPPEIGQLTSLKELDSSENKLTSIPPEIGQLTGLTSLVLSFNQLTSLPSEIGLLTSLTQLYLHSNELTFLPPEIGQLTNLTDLNLSYNQLPSLPPEIGFMTNISYLNITENNFTTIPQAICNLAQFNPDMNIFKDFGVTCEAASAKDALISIYSANPGNTLEWGVNNYPGVSFNGNYSISAIDIKDKGIIRITSAVATLELLELLDLRNNPLQSIALEVCALTFTSDFTLLTDPGEGCD